MIFSIRRFINWMFNKQPRYISTRLDEDLVEKDKIIKEMAKKIQSQDAQLSKIKAEEVKKRDSVKKVDES